MASCYWHMNLAFPLVKLQNLKMGLFTGVEASHQPHLPHHLQVFYTLFWPIYKVGSFNTVLIRANGLVLWGFPPHFFFFF